MSNINSPYRLLFALKVKQLRHNKGFSFLELSHRTGLSVSYLNEIERGKKYPKAEKLGALCLALGVKPGDLAGPVAGEGLETVAALLETNFLNELPLDLFGIDVAKVVEIIAHAPARFGALISTLLELARHHAVGRENFYFTALRSYLEMHRNFFEDLEASVDAFTAAYGINAERPIAEKTLEEILVSTYGYQIRSGGLDRYEKIRHLYYLYLPASGTLLLRSGLDAMQRSFSFGKELAFQYLQLTERAFTSSILQGKVFEEVLNHSRAIYFSVALHLPRTLLVQDLESFFRRETWDAEQFMGLMLAYRVTPEMFYHRLTNLLPQYFGLGDLFFMRFVHHAETGTMQVDRELHLNKKHQPHGSNLSEHYCRRWIAVSVLLGDTSSGSTMHAQVARFQEKRETYLCLTHIRQSGPEPGTRVSVTLGIVLDRKLRERVRFASDGKIPERQVHTTCERCPISDCSERAAPPIHRERRKRALEMENLLATLLKK